VKCDTAYRITGEQERMRYATLTFCFVVVSWKKERSWESFLIGTLFVLHYIKQVWILTKWFLSTGGGWH
jgi:hypothetical protein